VRRFDAGTQLDPRGLAQAVFGDSAGAVAWLGRITSVDVSYNRQRSSSFDRAGDIPTMNYQLGLGGLDAFRRLGELAAASAAENSSVNAGGAVALWLGLRANVNYRHTRGIGWSLRGDQQVPIRTRTEEWPSGTLTWVVTPSRRTLGRLLSSLNAQLTYRRAESANEQPTFGSEASVSLARSIDRTMAPAISMVWAGGVLTSFTASENRGEQLAAGNLFRSERSQRNATVTFSFRPPTLGRWRSNIRTTVQYSAVSNTTCLRGAGRDDCVPYVDSRQAQGQLTMDTDIPPNMSAGLQMAYILNEERQSNRKVAQLVITAFVQLSTSVGQLR